MITIEKIPWSFIKFSQLILRVDVWRSVWRICMWILGLKGLRLFLYNFILNNSNHVLSTWKFEKNAVNCSPFQALCSWGRCKEMWAENAWNRWSELQSKTLNFSQNNRVFFLFKIFLPFVCPIQIQCLALYWLIKALLLKLFLFQNINISLAAHEVKCTWYLHSPPHPPPPIPFPYFWLFASNSW